MTDVHLNVYILSEPQAGVTRLDLARNLAAALKQDISTIEKLLSRTRSLVKKNVDQALAEKYRALIEQAGGVCEVESYSQEELSGASVTTQASPLSSSSPSSPSSSLSVPVYKPTPTSGVAKVMIGIGAFFTIITLLSIVAAIALPAYQDYANRAKGSVFNLSQAVYTKDQRLSLNVPSNWRERNLNDDAILGIADLVGEGYVLVMEEAREDFQDGFTLAEYTQVILSLMKETVTDPQTPGKLRHLTINGLAAEQSVLIGEIDDLMITYLITTVESEQHFYQVLSWTLSSRFKNKHKLLRAISKTFVVHHEHEL